MSIKSQQPAFDRGQAYIRSQTSVADSEYMRRGDQPSKDDLPLPKLSDSRCFEDIYDTIIQQMSGAEFKKAMDAAVAVNRWLQRMPTADVASLDKIKSEIRDCYNVLLGLNPKIAGQMAACIQDTAEQYQEPAQAATQQWLASFPD